MNVSLQFHPEAFAWGIAKLDGILLFSVYRPVFSQIIQRSLQSNMTDPISQQFEDSSQAIDQK